MIQRTVTGLCLILLLALALWAGGWVFSVLYMATICCSMYEMYRAMKDAGHRPVEWPCWLCVALSIVLFNLKSSVTLLMPLVGGAFMMVATMVILRTEPQLEDIFTSALPLVGVLLPGMCMLGLQNAPTRGYQLLLTLMAFGIPLAGDTAAYFIGSRFGVRKLCPAVSPNKSLEGAAAGLVGSILFSMICAGIVSAFTEIPPFWHFPILGLFVGAAGQMGDLFASLIKRHCGIKDYGAIFPGHGGMMDRLDSVYWATVVIYMYLNLNTFVPAALPAA
ncbi:MAG: phosphatidate cytidylyltransferase [Clostridia bacterium]|nr:phosphatidate cytidylyltransferase [Clostridia bacterium]